MNQQIDALSEVVDAVRGRDIEVYMDGGVRTGTDVFKALGMGARAVFVGRPILWGLACQVRTKTERISEGTVDQGVFHKDPKLNLSLSWT